MKQSIVNIFIRNRNIFLSQSFHQSQNHTDVFSLIIALQIRFQISFHLRSIYKFRSLCIGFFANYIFNQNILITRDYRNIFFDNSCFFGCYLLQRFAQNILMVKLDIRNRRNQWSDDIRGIQPSTETYFNNSKIHLVLIKIFKRHDGRKFKKRRQNLLWNLF